MNLMALLTGLLPWATSPLSAFTRVYVACGLLAIEVQVITWIGSGTLASLLPLNVALALAAAAVGRRSAVPAWAWIQTTRRALPTGVVLALALVVVALNVWRPLEAADPYELDRMRFIADVGSLRYSPDLDPKANIVAAFYELMLADLSTVPGVGPWLIRLHGLAGLAVLCLAVAGTRAWLAPSSAWAAALPFVVPAAFHQMVLVKSDLFIGAPAFVALAWAAAPVATRSWRDPLWAGWLAGLAAAAKLTNGAVVMGLVLALRMRDGTWRSMPASFAGALGGVLTGGFVLMLWQNHQVYGDALASAQVEAIGNVNRTLGAATLSLFRFAVSLVDMSLVTRLVWPGRGGWGGPFGLPMLWSLAALAASWRAEPGARRALLAGSLCLVTLGAVFPDADLSHRLVLGPALMLVTTAAAAAAPAPGSWQQRFLPACVILSAIQIARSAVLYAMGAQP